MTNQKTYIQSLKSKLEELDLEVQRQEALAKSKSNEAYAQFLEKKKNMTAKQEAMNKELQKFADASDDAWEDLKSGIDDAWRDLKDAADQARSNFS